MLIVVGAALLDRIMLQSQNNDRDAETARKTRDSKRLFRNVLS